MRLGNEEDDAYVEDRRGDGGGGRRLGMSMGLGGTLVVLALSLLFKRNLFNDLGTPAPHSGAPTSSSRSTPTGQARVSGEEELKRVAVGAFNDAQRTWTTGLRGSGPGYRPAHLVLFWDETHSGCGAAGAEMGPFYCPADERVYIDLGFYRELARRFGAPGDFAQAYVIAHEVGHHVQNLLGIEARVRQSQRQGPRDRNRLSVLMELQADCFAGVWGHSAQRRGLLEPGDVDEGLRAAAAVGDDRLQKAATGRVSPESFTHGSAAQRSHWFRRGLDSGRLEDCDTFAAGAGD
ncbi:MAG TPA: neutral zinc metallopeptidase [Pseudomonadota bacterium]|nr:neutral zinc metallopeptidase [Pseudomonadota bacterium]